MTRSSKRPYALLTLALVFLLVLGAGWLSAAQTLAQSPPGQAATPDKSKPHKVNQENKKAGTTTWKSKELDEFAKNNKDKRRPTGGPKPFSDNGGPADQAPTFNPGPISGYAGRESINVGQSIDLMVSTTRPRYDLEVYRMGWYGGAGARLMQSATNLPGQNRGVPAPDPTTGLIAATWPVSYTVQTDATWVSGVYLTKLTTDTDVSAYIVFVLRDDAEPSDILYHVALSTYQAYNGWGGKSLYEFSSTGGRAYKVSFDRPYDNWEGAGGFFDGDYNMVRWLESQGYDVSYASSVDLHTSPNPLSNRKLFLSNFHDEYWSKAMRDHVTAARDAGKSLAFFDSNNVYWQTRLEPSASGVPNRVVVCYKTVEGNVTDPMTATNPSLTTTRWRDPPVNRPENSLLGIMFEGQFDWLVSYPWVVTNSNHWVYAGTGLQEGASIPGVVGYEFDRVWDNGQTPLNLTALSNSPVTYSGVQSVSHGALYTAASGALVFSAGTNRWPWKLDDNEYLAVGADARIQRMTENILDRFITNVPVPLTPTPTPFPTRTPVPSAYRAMVLSDNPAGYWRLDEPSGTIAIDQKGANHGTYFGSPALDQPGAITGDPDQAVAFGTNKYGNVPFAAALNPAVFSVEVWAKPGGGAGSYRGVVASRFYPLGWVLYLGAGNQWEFWLNNGTSMMALVGGAAPLDSWAHVVGTFDGTTATLYVDGVQVASGAATAGYSPQTSVGLMIGQGDAGGGFWFPGVLDELAVYNKALTPAQVQQHYNAGTSGASVATATPTAIPTATPTTIPTATPTAIPTATPTSGPPATAPPGPSATPTTAPATSPTPTPTTAAGNTGFLGPAANAADTGGDGNGFETSAANAHVDGAGFAVDTNSGTGTGTSCTGTGKDKHRFLNFGLPVPAGATIDGIEARLDARVDATAGSPRVCVQLSRDGGATWTTGKTTPVLTTTEGTYILGSATDTWGQTWTAASVSDANFRVRVIAIASNLNRDFSLDWVAVAVSYH